MRRRAGFTLVEVLVATMLLTIVMTAVYTLVYSVISSWRSVEENFDMYREARNAFSVMEREFQSVLAPFLFEGESDEVTLFTVSEPFYMEKSEGRHLLRVRYYVSSAKHALMREEGIVTAALPPGLPTSGEMPEERIRLKHKEKFILAENVRDLSVKYVWLPLPKERDKKKVPPEPIERIVVNKHSKRWRLGMPQALELEMTLRDPKDKSKEQTVTTLIPIRTQGTLHELDDLQKNLKDEL